MKETCLLCAADADHLGCCKTHLERAIAYMEAYGINLSSAILKLKQEIFGDRSVSTP